MTRSSAPHAPARVQQALREVGQYLMQPYELTEHLNVADNIWEQFGSHWEQLCDDPYARELGTRRQRRYDHFVVRPAEDSVQRLDHDEFLQPEDSNPLYLDRQRHFEPLTEAFAEDPVLHRLLHFLGGAAQTLDTATQWSAKVHPFRVIAGDGGDSVGKPTPEGLHRDGVTLVSTLLVARRNAVGGQSSVVDSDGRVVRRTTLSEPGTLLLGDDRRTLHGVTAIRPARRGVPAVRDVLVITFAPRT